MDKNTVVARLRPLFPFLYEALEDAWQSTVEFFAKEQEPFDVFLAPAVFRWRAKNTLRRLQSVIGDLHIEELANNGLSIVYHEYRIRIWKTVDGQLPESEASFLKDAFLRQRQLVFGFMDIWAHVTLNLVVLWSVDPDRKLRPLKLICPRKDDTGIAPIQEEWSYQIPHPNTILGGGESKTPSTQITFEWP